MRPINQITFHDNVSAAAEGEILQTMQGDSLVIAVSGTFTGLTLKVQGQQYHGGDWYDISVIELSQFEVQQYITAPGAYMAVGVSGFQVIRANLTAITTGSATVTGRLSADG